MERVEYQSILIQDLVNYKKVDELNLNPWYQRRSVWTPAQKSYLINTLFESKPIPAIYMRYTIDLEKEKSIKEVVDGQQRSRAILEYKNDEFPSLHPHYDRKVLFSELTPSLKTSFLQISLPVANLLGADDSDVIDIFGRINSVSKTLNAEEKRNANFSGDMKQFCLSHASAKVKFWKNYNVFSATKIARMAEITFVADVVNSLIYGLSAYSSPVLNKLYKDFDNDFPRRGEINERMEKIFNILGSLNIETIKDTIFSRPPLLFSLMIVIDEIGLEDTEKLKKAMLDIDSIFEDDNQAKTDKDKEFHFACSSSTQIKEHRTIRNDYIKSFF